MPTVFQRIYKKLADLIDIVFTSPQNGDVVTYNSTSQKWVNAQPAGGGGGIPSSRTISTTAPLAGGGDLSANRTLSMPAATSGQDGYLTHTDWSTFNGKGAGSVTSVGLSAPSMFSVSGSPVTSSGTLAMSLANQTANMVFCGPSTGSAAPTFRTLGSHDLPTTLVYFTSTVWNLTTDLGFILSDGANSISAHNQTGTGHGIRIVGGIDGCDLNSGSCNLLMNNNNNGTTSLYTGDGQFSIDAAETQFGHGGTYVSLNDANGITTPSPIYLQNSTDIYNNDFTIFSAAVDQEVGVIDGSPISLAWNGQRFRFAFATVNGTALDLETSEIYCTSINSTIGDGFSINNFSGDIYISPDFDDGYQVYMGDITISRDSIVNANSEMFITTIGNNLALTADAGADITMTARSVQVFAPLILPTSHTPSSHTDSGTTGQIAWDSGFIYVCVGANSWKRAAIASW